MHLAPRLAAVVLGTPLVAVAALLALAPPRVDLVVVNGTGAPVVVTVGGRPPARVEAGEELALEGLVAGRTHLVAQEAAVATGQRPARVDELTGDLLAGLGAPRPTYVWDVAAATSFVVVSRGYGDRKDERAVAPLAPGGRRLFVVPPGFIPGVDASFPELARVTSGTTGTVRQTLWTRAHAERVGKAEVVLLVDDWVGTSVRFELDGVVQTVVRSGTAITLAGVPPGRHTLRAVALRFDGVETGAVHTLEADLLAEPFAPPAVWVWNVAGAQQEYRVVHRVYGGDERPPGPATMASPGELFRLPADFYPGINARLPDRWTRAGVLKALWTPLAFKLETGPFGGQSEMTLEGVEKLFPGLGKQDPSRPAPR